MLATLMYLDIIGWAAIGVIAGMFIGLLGKNRSVALPIVASVIASIAGAFWINGKTGFPLIAFTLQSLLVSILAACIAAGIGTLLATPGQEAPFE